MSPPDSVRPSPEDVWHAEDVPSEHLDNGMASIVEMADTGSTQIIRCRIDDGGYLRRITRRQSDYVRRDTYEPYEHEGVSEE